jgi:YesN/AraC family two-component response regulator
MSPMEFSPLGPRLCQWCRKLLPVTGRSDQQYCTDSCRGKGRRHGTPGLDWPARAAAAEQRVEELQAQLDQQAQAQAAAQPYEQRYEDLSRLLGGLARELSDARVVSSYLYFVDELLLAYQQHPGLAVEEASARRRVRSLQQLRTELAEAYQTLRDRQQQAQQRQEGGQPPEAS